MRAYSLINCSSDYFSVGIYTSLENLYVALQDCVKEDLEHCSKEDIKERYKIIKVYLDNEPNLNNEFSTYGNQIPVDWNKIFDDDEMVNNVKMYTNKLIADATEIPAQALNFRGQAYGALMFALDNFDFTDFQKTKLVNFWEEAYKTFNKIYNERG